VIRARPVDAVHRMVLGHRAPIEDWFGQRRIAREQDPLIAAHGAAVSRPHAMPFGHQRGADLIEQVLFERDGATLVGEVLGRHFYGRRTIRLEAPGGESVAGLIERIGHVPLPPYIKRDDEASDRDRYQTVYARSSGSVAAPTAGLHFTQPLLEELASRGVERTTITLHVGYGTFKPVRVDNVEDHDVDPERYVVSVEAADALTRAKRDRQRIIAVGTTTTRALESLIIDDGIVRFGEGDTRLFIRPGHRFQLVSGLVTNFHLPKSSLLILAAAFAGREEILAVYRDAVQRRYRFYSYGDAMLII